MNEITRNATDGQKRQLRKFLDDVLEKVAVEKLVEELGLDSLGAQRVIEHGDEFAEAIRIAAIASLKDLSVSDKFKDEEVESNYGYLSGYKPNRDTSIDLVIADFEAQSKTLDKFFNCGTSFNADWIVRTHAACPSWVEKFFAQFDWRLIATTYGEAVQKVLDMIKQTRSGAFHNYREGQLGPDRLRQSARTAAVFQKLGNEQKDHDILVVPAQFGLHHRGRSVRRAREVFPGNEFGLGAFAVDIMILTHPERLMHYDDLWIDCAGDEFDDPDSDDRFDHAPYFKFSDVQVKFGTEWFDDADDSYGSASGFVPQ